MKLAEPMIPINEKVQLSKVQLLAPMTPCRALSSWTSMKMSGLTKEQLRNLVAPREVRTAGPLMTHEWNV